MNRFIRVACAAALAASVLGLAACGDDDSASEAPTSAGAQELTKVKLQLQWFTQAQFAGYFAAVDQGYYKDAGPRRRDHRGRRRHRAADPARPGPRRLRVAWVPKALAVARAGANITDVGQVFQRSGTLQVSFKDKDITGPADLRGKKVGNWGFGNEFELFAGMTKAGLDPAKDVTLVQQQFDMQALLQAATSTRPRR